MPNLEGKNEEVSDEALSSVEEKLNKLNFGDLPEQDPEPDEPTPDPDPETDPEPEPEADPEPEPEPTVEKPDEQGSKDKDSTPEAEIPEGYIRAAKRQGWTDEDIAATIEADSDRALRLFANAYETTNKATRDFAAIGREKAAAAVQEAKDKAEANQVEVEDYMTADEITKAADGDEAVAKMLTNFNAALKKRDAALAKANTAGPSVEDINFARSDQAAATARANATANAATELFIKQFFGAESMKSYSDFYGVIDEGQNMGDLTPNQHERRVNVLQLADQLIAGKAAQGIKISDTEAMEDAHLVVTAPMREKVITDGIRSSLKKRSKGKTLRPAVSKSNASSGGAKPAKDRNEAIANAEGRLAKLNWN